jgi:hypothetical protein
MCERMGTSAVGFRGLMRDGVSRFGFRVSCSRFEDGTLRSLAEPDGNLARIAERSFGFRVPRFEL